VIRNLDTVLTCASLSSTSMSVTFRSEKWDNVTTIPAYFMFLVAGNHIPQFYERFPRDDGDESMWCQQLLVGVGLLNIPCIYFDKPLFIPTLSLHLFHVAKTSLIEPMIKCAQGVQERKNAFDLHQYELSANKWLQNSSQAVLNIKSDETDISCTITDQQLLDLVKCKPTSTRTISPLTGLDVNCKWQEGLNMGLLLLYSKDIMGMWYQFSSYHFGDSSEVRGLSCVALFIGFLVYQVRALYRKEPPQVDDGNAANTCGGNVVTLRDIEEIKTKLRDINQGTTLGKYPGGN
jgi:hypothetical protein